MEEKTMKCVKKNDQVKRVDDETARTLVDKKGFSYCSKSEWKAQRA